MHWEGGLFPYANGKLPMCVGRTLEGRAETFTMIRAEFPRLHFLMTGQLKCVHVQICYVSCPEIAKSLQSPLAGETFHVFSSFSSLTFSDSMAPLSAVARQAHVVYWAKHVGKARLHPELVQEKLCEHFASRGETLSELPLELEREDPEGWRVMWRMIAKDAGVDGEADRESVIYLLQALGKSGSETRSKADAAQRVLDTLASAGMTIPASAHAVVSKVLSKSKREADKREWTNIEVVFIIYFLIAPSNADEEWYDREQEKIVSAGFDEESDDDEEVGAINMRLAPSAIKVLAKEQGSPTLERVLAKGGEVMLDFFESVGRKLNAAGMHSAAQRFQSVVSYPVRRHKFDEKAQRQYLQRYFFIDFLGRGLMKLKATNSLTSISADRHMMPAPVNRGFAVAPPPQLLTPGCLPSVGGDAEGAMMQLAQMFSMMQNTGGPTREHTDTDSRVEDVTEGAHAFTQKASGENRVLCRYCGSWHKNAGVTCDAYVRDMAAAQARSKARETREKAEAAERKATKEAAGK